MARQRSAKPSTAVRICQEPLKHTESSNNYSPYLFLSRIRTQTGESIRKETNINRNGNRLVTDECYAELRERMRKELGGQMNVGIAPEILAIGTEMAVYHIEKDARKFAEYAKAMIADVGDVVRPYLKSFYNTSEPISFVNYIRMNLSFNYHIQLRNIPLFHK